MGSSPLTRGKHPCAGCADVAGGLIPAHAGKTASSSGGSTASRAHPRSRGENAWVARRIAPLSGSSPLTRGKHCVELRVRLLVGLIPAHAGKTSMGSVRPPRSGAHPRSRGENQAPGAQALGAWGSSPLTRGKRLSAFSRQGIPGLIPAHAGKTPSSTEPSCLSGAHPRSRGENSRSRLAKRAHCGSSPLTRGKHFASGI